MNAINWGDCWYPYYRHKFYSGYIPVSIQPNLDYILVHFGSLTLCFYFITRQQQIIQPSLRPTLQWFLQLRLLEWSRGSSLSFQCFESLLTPTFLNTGYLCDWKLINFSSSKKMTCWMPKRALKLQMLLIKIFVGVFLKSGRLASMRPKKYI